MNIIDWPLREDAFSSLPLTFLGQEAHNCLGAINAIDLLENGSPDARRAWRNAQIVNLIKHARRHSRFWSKRAPLGEISADSLRLMPVLQREELRVQIEKEGSLVKAGPGSPLQSYTTSGSTGVPIRVYMLESNIIYNGYRTLAEYLIKGLTLDDNLTELTCISTGNRDFLVENKASWAGPLATMFRNGPYKKIDYANDDAQLLEELLKDRVGYLKSPNGFVEKLFGLGGLDLFSRLGVRAWIHLSDARDQKIVDALRSVGIASISNYSSGEVGLIAVECPATQDAYHVTTSNVHVEVDKSSSAEVNGRLVHRLLITHLHSYATPIIRYDIGDMGALHNTCACGHKGPVLTDIVGRKKKFVQLLNGEVKPFYGRAHELLKEIPFLDCRVRQTTPAELVVEIVCASPLNKVQEDLIRDRLSKLLGEASLTFQIKQVEKIAWEDCPKKHFFTSLI